MRRAWRDWDGRGTLVRTLRPPSCPSEPPSGLRRPSHPLRTHPLPFCSSLWLQNPVEIAEAEQATGEQIERILVCGIVSVRASAHRQRRTDRHYLLGSGSSQPPRMLVPRMTRAREPCCSWLVRPVLPERCSRRLQHCHGPERGFAARAPVLKRLPP